MKFNLLLAFACSVIFSGCMQVQPLEVCSVTCCELKKALKTETEVSFTVIMHNPNAFPITVKNYDLEVRINGNPVGNTVQSEPTIIAANSTLEKEVVISASTQKLLSGTLLMGLNALFKEDPTTLELEVVGSVVGSAKGMSKRVRIREKYPLKMHP